MIFYTQSDPAKLYASHHAEPPERSREHFLKRLCQNSHKAGFLIQQDALGVTAIEPIQHHMLRQGLVQFHLPAKPFHMMIILVPILCLRIVYQPLAVQLCIKSGISLQRGSIRIKGQKGRRMVILCRKRALCAEGIIAACLRQRVCKQHVSQGRAVGSG